jgi:lysozyme
MSLFVLSAFRNYGKIQMSAITKAIEIVKDQYELLLTATKINDVWVIGYNHTLNVFNGLTMTEQVADTILEQTLTTIQTNLFKVVKVRLNPNQITALILLIFDIGLQAFKNSNLLANLQAGDFKSASYGFLIFNKNGRVVSVKVARRRAVERNIFNYIGEL